MVEEELHLPAGVIVALFEGCESSGGAAFEAELRAKFGPVEFEGGAALDGRTDGLAFDGLFTRNGESH